MTASEPSTVVDPDSEVGRGSSTLLNAAIGGAASVLLFFFVPFSTVLGGAIAGYLEGGDLASGAWVGAVAGFLTMIPVLLCSSVVLAIGFFVPEGLPIALVVFVLASFLAVYVIGMSVAGGVIGVYLKNDVLVSRERASTQ